MTFDNATFIGDLLRLRAPSAEIHAYGESSPYTVALWYREQVAFVWKVGTLDQAFWLCQYMGEFLCGFEDDCDWRPLVPKVYQHFSERGELVPAHWCGSVEELAP